MSREIERSFFDVRYTFPGFTFLLLVLSAIGSWLFHLTVGRSYAGQNVPPELLVVLVGALFLLNGAPVGFLVSQPWLIIHKVFFMGRTYLREFRQEQEHGQGISESIVLMDFEILRRADDRQLRHLQRRWDLLNLLGSEVSSISCGLLIASILRIVLIGDLTFQYIPLVLWIEYILGGFTLILLYLGLAYVVREHARFGNLIRAQPIRPQETTL